jgi:hypothetical protein
MKDCVQRVFTKDYANQNKSFREFKVGDMELKGWEGGLWTKFST